MTTPPTSESLRPAFQFATMEQQSHAATLGMWTFLSSEVLFFGSLLVSMLIMRIRWPDAFAQGANELKWYLGGINTAVLLGSSYAMALAVHAAEHAEAKPLIHRLIITAVLGLVFIGIKGSEYVIEYHEKLVPAFNYSSTAPDGTQRLAEVQLFMIFYFCLTLLHAFHMMIGIVGIVIVAVRARNVDFVRKSKNLIDGLGLYWHFVDVVWVFLFPMLYLLRHP